MWPVGPGTTARATANLRELVEPGERLTSVPVTRNFFESLGVQPVIGRSFSNEECQGRVRPPGHALELQFLARRFASEPNVLGRKLILNNQPVTVVGVLPASFDFCERLCSGHADRVSLFPGH